MHRQGLIPWLWGLIRNYAIPLALLGVFAATVIQTYVTGIPPVPQQPPMGYVLEENETRLQWHRGTLEGKWTLQVSENDPEFTAPFIEREVGGTTHHLNNLKPGHTFYWRLKQNNTVSTTANFKISEHAIAF